MDSINNSGFFTGHLNKYTILKRNTLFVKPGMMAREKDQKVDKQSPKSLE
jgi:hypothetical protein